jgi:hypothetical protein
MIVKNLYLCRKTGSGCKYPIEAWIGERIFSHCLKVNNHPQSGWLAFSCCGNRRRIEKAEARLCFGVEFAVAPSLGKNQVLSLYRFMYHPNA